MAIHLIIDGYNLIRQSPYLQAMEARDLELGREALLATLAEYRQSRSQPKITVVFDGWGGGDRRESRDRQAGMTVIYSRLGERADEVIKRLLEKDRGRGVVVSSDRELQDYAQRVGATWISAPEFELSYLQGAAREAEAEEEEAPHAKSPKKGPAHRASKSQRQRRQRLKKL